MNGTMRTNSLGHLEIGGCDVVDLAKQYGTPLYVYDEADIVERAREYRQSLAELPGSQVAYAGKAFLTTGMCHLVDSLGLSLDVVSGGELHTALQANYPAERIFFHGNNKSEDELRVAVRTGVGRIVVDSHYELEMLSKLAEAEDRTVRVLLRLTPGVEAHTHTYIQTGQLDSKFGLGIASGEAIKAMKRAAQLPRLALTGVHCHIGSQIFDISAFQVTIDIMVDFLAEAANQGVAIEELDLGGGLGIRYTEEDTPVAIREFGQLLTSNLVSAAQMKGIPVPKLIIEPGRSLVGEAGTTIYTVGTIKDVPGMRTYASVDGGMGDNPRVSLYQAKYKGIVANKANLDKDRQYTIAGKCCESADMLIFDTMLPLLEPGDLLAVLSTGAYHFSMASNYNMLPRPAVVTVYEGESEVLVERQSYEDLVRGQRVPQRWRRQPSLVG